MRKTEEELRELLDMLLLYPENECVEFKEAKESFSGEKIGKYFSAMSNEAVLRGRQYSWLVFGVVDKTRKIIGTNYCVDDNFNDIKRSIADNTTDGLTFIEIYSMQMDGNRVVMFQIPAAVGNPTKWKKIAYGRDGESLVPLSDSKAELIKGYANNDWSAHIVEGATLSDLDPKAIAIARRQYCIKNAGRLVAKESKALSDVDFLSKLQLVRDGKVTNAAMLLLGRADRSFLMADCSPTIVWKYFEDGNYSDYEHFSIPFITAADEAVGRIRNMRYRYMVGSASVFPQEVDRYDTFSLRELLNNSIVHQDYRMKGAINIIEYNDRVEFSNRGSFIPGTINEVLKDGFCSPYNRNRLLAAAMVSFNMVDIVGSGIKRVFKTEREKFFPMPDYDLSDECSVKVCLYGRILNIEYTKILAEKTDLLLGEVYLLDKVQKKQKISLEECAVLRKKGLVEGRYPNIYPSSDIARITDMNEEYVENKGLDNDFYKEMIVSFLEQRGYASRVQLDNFLVNKLPKILDDKKKKTRVHNLLMALRQDGRIKNEGTNRHPQWTAVMPRGEKRSN